MDSTTWTIGILLAGVVVVIGGVLVLRLHAFLALILGALVVGTLTPATSIQQFATEKAAVPIVAVDPDAGTATIPIGDREGAQPGMVYLVVRKETATGRYTKFAELEIEEIETYTTEGGREKQRAIASIRDADRVAGVEGNEPPAESAGGSAVAATPATPSLHEGDLAIHPLQLREAAALAQETVGARVAAGFGSTCTNIAILIAMASIIGKCLLDSGAADRVVRSTLKLLGEKGAPLSFLSSGFLLGIPVFFDTVFYLMIPLGKAMRMRTGRNYLVYVLTIVSGATMAHSLVPPTPGPLFVAEQLTVDIGVMILAGGIVGLFTAGFGYFYAGLANRIWDLPLRESPEFSLEDLEEIARRDERELPPTWLSLLPIILPVVLIGGNTILNQLKKSDWFREFWPPQVFEVAATLGDKNIALVISAAIAMGMLVWQKRTSREQLAKSMQAALAGGGLIILITAGGGAFGRVLQQTGVAGLIRDVNQDSPYVIVVLAFLITTAVRTAQGSATVAMITAVGILSGLADSLTFHPVYLALAIGCGSKPIAWMNDSGFWVITKMSGMTEAEGLKYVTPMTTLMGLVGLVVVLAGVTLFPMPPG